MSNIVERLRKVAEQIDDSLLNVELTDCADEVKKMLIQIAGLEGELDDMEEVLDDIGESVNNFR